jgi:hypothetical protein
MTEIRLMGECEPARTPALRYLPVNWPALLCPQGDAGIFQGNHSIPETSHSFPCQFVGMT